MLQYSHMQELLITYKPYLLGLHLIGVVIGFGGALVADMLFFKFLKDYKISKMESQVLRYVSETVWVGIIVLMISGLALFAIDPVGLMNAAKFQAKIAIFLVIIINGLVLHFSIQPTLRTINFRDKHKHKKGELSRYRKRAFASGAISLSSWLSIFVLASLPRSQPYSFVTLIGVYLLVVVIAIISALVLENLLQRQGSQS